MNEERVCRAALTAWGADAQTLMVFEEIAELQKELCKAARGKDNREAIAEEIADVEIMLAQMKILHDCAEAVAAYRESKLRRLAIRCGLETGGGPEPVVKLGPGASFRLEDTHIHGQYETPDGAKVEAVERLQNLCNFCKEMESFRNGDSGDAGRQYGLIKGRAWGIDVVMLEFAIYVLSDLREIKEVRIPAEPNTPGGLERSGHDA